jgi:hypothetical protein
MSSEVNTRCSGRDAERNAVAITGWLFAPTAVMS